MPNGWPDLSKHSGRVYSAPEPWRWKKPKPWTPKARVEAHFVGDNEPTTLTISNPAKPFAVVAAIAKGRGVGIGWAKVLAPRTGGYWVTPSELSEQPRAG